MAVGERTIPSGRLPDSQFFLAAAMIQFVLVFWGFGPSFFWAIAFPPPHGSMLTDRGAAAHALFLVHGLFFTAWILLYVLQSALVAVRRPALHRRLGQLSVALIPIIILLGIAISIEGLRVGFHGGVQPVAFATSSVILSLTFGAFAWAGYAERRVPPAHKRWMMLATMVLVGAATARIQAIGNRVPAWFDATSLLLPALGLWDLATLKRVHPVTLWGGLVFLIVDIGALPLTSTGVWLALVQQVTGSR